MQNNIVHLNVLALLLVTQVQGALFPTNLLRTLWKNPKYIVKGYEAVSDACQAAEEACSAAQSQALAPITLQTTRTLTTPVYVTAYNPYVATITYTPPMTPPQAPQLLGTAPNVVAPRLEKDKRQDAGSTNIFPEIAAAWNWTLDADQQAVLDSDSWLMWETNPLCFWSNMLAFYREAAADESSDSSSTDDIYAPPCDTNWGTGTAEFWTCVYQDLVLREIPSALAYVYYPRTSLPLSSATCSVLGYSTATVMYYSSTPGPTQIGIETSSGGSTFATAGASDESSSDASVTSSSAARRLEATYSIADHALLGPLACSVIAILAIATVL